MEIIKQLAKEIGVKVRQVEAAVKLIDEGNTIPFIARYRKEVTGALDDEVLRQLDTRLKYLRNLEEKKETVIRTVEDQGKMTDELRKSIDEAMTLVELEDLYRPYRPKRRTRATIAREKGLEPLSRILLLRKETRPMEEVAADFLGEEVETPQEALEGAMDIIAEDVSEDSDYRKHIRRECMLNGMLESKAKNPEVESVYELYYDYSEPIRSLTGHRVLALNRGEKEKILTVKIVADEESLIRTMVNKLCGKTENPVTDPWLRQAAADAFHRLVFPSVEREVRNQLTEDAEEGAMKVFQSNLHQLLMQPPIVNKTVLGWDPAYRTGCKLAVVDPTGNVLETKVIYPTKPHARVAEAKRDLMRLIRKYDVDLISLGNGTASRESEQIISDLLREEHLKEVAYVVVNEAGASVYSAGALAAEELPDFDVGQRSATSIARRLQDPLAELVKIDPKSIGVGQYQHDMNQKRLDEVLTGVVEDCVNGVGIDLNTASAALLEYISGISKTVSKNIVTFRNENGRFKNRKALLKVPKLGPKMFEQCAGFLRITEGDEPLDRTAVHPEHYAEAYELMDRLGYDKRALQAGTLTGISKKISDYKELSRELGIGEWTLRDIVSELEKPSRDPRRDMPQPILRSDVLEIEDLQEGMVLKGTVRNVIDFGAFVDIGVHEDGLVHISQLSKRYIKHPLDVVHVGDIVEVKVLSVDVKKRRIALTMKF